MDMETQGPKRNRILLADDDLQMLAVIHRLLQSDFDVIKTVSDGHSLVKAAFQLRPDIIVTDISMPLMKGIEAVREIHSTLQEIKCIFLTMHGSRRYRLEADKAGAVGMFLNHSHGRN